MNKIAIILVILLVSILSVKSIMVEDIFAAVSTQRHPLKKLENADSLITRKLELSTKEVSKPQPQKKTEPVLPNSILLDVPILNQLDQPQLYNGCEVTSLAMLLNFHGIQVTKNTLAANIATVPLDYSNNLHGNPSVGFVGDMVGGPGLGVYNGPVFDLAKKYVGDKAVNLTDHPFTDILKKVGQGLPVWIITTSNFVPVSDFQQWNTPQGTIQVTYSEHSVVITGYDQNYIYVNDPYGVKNRKVDRTDFIKAWDQMGQQAIVIEK